MPTKPRKSKERRDPQWAREEAARPSPWLGYDRDRLGCYFAERGALELAESQFRRAVWLNPFEPSFKVHWALALTKLERKPEAHDLLREVLAKNPADTQALEMWRQNWPDEQPAATTSASERAAPADESPRAGSADAGTADGEAGP